MKNLRHKFNAKSTMIDNIKFSSKKEAAHYQKLKQLEKEGKILFFLRQVPIQLCDNIKYILDFLIFHAPKDADSPGEVEFCEVKGYMTKDAKIKISMAEKILGVKINIV